MTHHTAFIFPAAFTGAWEEERENGLKNKGSICVRVRECVCVFQGRVLQGTVGVLKWVCRGGKRFGRVGNHSLRVLCRLFLLPFHLSYWEDGGGGWGAGGVLLRLTAASISYLAQEQ